MSRMRRSVLVDGDAQQVLRLGVDVAQQAGGEQAERAANAGERGAQLVRDGGDELVLDGVEVGALDERESCCCSASWRLR